MIGSVIYYHDGEVSVKLLKDDYEFSVNEPVEIESCKMTFFEELQKLYWVLVNWTVKEKRYLNLPVEDIRFFNSDDNFETLERKSYALIRHRTEYYREDYDSEGRAVPVLRSVSSRESSQRQLSDHFDNAVRYIGACIDMKDFWIENEEARKRLGKEY